MQTISNWLGKYNISTHTLGILALALTAAFEGYKPFHDMITGFYTGLPTPVQVLIGTGGFLYALYKTGALTSTQAQAKPPSVTGIKALGIALGCLGFFAQHHRMFRILALVAACFTACVLMTGCSELEWLNDAINLIPVLTMGATSLLSFIASLSGNAVAATVLADLSAWSSKVEAGLKNLESLVQEYKTTPGESKLQEIEDVANLIVGDINSFDQIIGVPAVLGSKIQSLAQLILSQLEAFISLLPAVKASASANGATAPTAIPAFTAPTTHAAFKASFNTALTTPTGDDTVDAAAATAKTL